ncbi:MAG: hypothetical protein AAGC53_09155 [Actinomycetota bacterium]
MPNKMQVAERKVGRKMTKIERPSSFGFQFKEAGMSVKAMQDFLQNGNQYESNVEAYSDGVSFSETIAINGSMVTTNVTVKSGGTTTSTTTTTDSETGNTSQTTQTTNSDGETTTTTTVNGGK